MVELISEWINLQRNKGVEISVATVGALYDFGYWLDKQAAQQSVHLTAFGADWRGRLGKWLISLGNRIAQIGGR